MDHDVHWSRDLSRRVPRAVLRVRGRGMTASPDKSKSSLFLGCVADDVTGATDMAINLVQGGMRTVQFFGVPTDGELDAVDADAVVVALKSRSIASEVAVVQSLRSLDVLRNAGAQRFFFKYCSTFDSTDEGNIGPVAEALLKALETRQTIFCPAFPRNGRTVYQGHLFVHGCLLNESGMEQHPLNPMTDANLVRVLDRQTNGRVGLLPYDAIKAGAVRAELESLARAGVDLVIADACDDDQLVAIARDVADMPLITGGSGIARWLPAAWRETGQLDAKTFEPTWSPVGGRAAILAGSCSAATRRQVDLMKTRCPSKPLDVPALMSDPKSALTDVLQWAALADSNSPVLIYSTSAADDVKELQNHYGVRPLATAIEEFLASMACELVSDHGVRRLVIAGGETSGAVVDRLGVRSIRIGPEICPGVPCTRTLGARPLALALKSGNFGEDDFFESALESLV